MFLLLLLAVSFHSLHAEQRLGQVANAYPSFSPDGKKILFQSNRTGKWQLFVMNLDGSSVTRLTNTTANDVTAIFSPDGKQIVFASDRSDNEEIYVMNADGSNPQNISRDAASDSHPNWSKDGSQIVFCSTRGDGENDDVYTMKADGTGVKRLTNNGLYWDTFPSFSPDGTKILFRRLIRERVPDGTAVNSEIFVMNSDGSNAINLSKEGHFDGWPSWSPDGKRIAFSTNRDDVYQIYVMNADGSNPVRAVESFYTDVRPQWSPDGKSIVFDREYQGFSEILIHPIQ